MAYADHIVRKSAHFLVYMILAIAVGYMIRRLRFERPKIFALTMLITVFYAVTDEFHQLFVPGRGGQIKDVLIDSTGSLVGILIFLTIDRTVSKNKKQTFK